MALNKIDKKMIDDSFVQEVENVKNTASDLTVKLAETDSLISSAASIPRYTFNPKQNFDTLIAQMREEMAKASKIIVTRDAGGATYFDVIRKINSTGGNVTVRIEAEVNGTVTPVFKKADTVLFGGISGNLAMASISEGIWEKTFSPTESTKYFINIGINIPNTEPSTTFANITKLSIVQDGVELVTELNRRLSGATGFIGATQITADYGYRHNLKNNGEVRAPKIIYVSHTGITSGLGESSNKALRWDYFADTVYPFLKGNTSFVVLESGIYRMANRTQILKVVSADKVTFVCPNGKATFDCGEEKPTSVWSEINGSDFISVTYDPVNHWNASVKDGTLSPIVTFLESSTKTRLKLTKVASQADAQLTDGSYFYDFANKKMYINWQNGVSYYISIPEVQSGFRIEHKDAEINFINIDVKSAETSAFFIIPSSYGKGKLSWYGCAASSSGSGDDFHIQYIDTDMLNCRSSMSGNDGFNFHYEGVSNLVNCESWGAFNDGISHHENTKGYVWNTRGLHNGTSFSTPAYGAFVYHESCYSEGNGYDNPRETYSGGYAVLGGEGYQITKAIYVNCESVNDERGICATTGDGNAAVIFAQNCKITNPSKVGYKASNGAELLTVNPQGSLTQEGSNIKVI